MAPYNLSRGISSKLIPVRDLQIHYLEAGDSESPLILLLHGFPELSFSWRKIMVPLSSLGYHVVAPDQRGYGQTRSQNQTASSSPITFNDDLTPFRMLNLVHDVVALVFALGHTSAALLVGHDFGSMVAAHTALIRPDLFAKLALMSAPFPGTPSLPFNVSKGPRNAGVGGSYAPSADDLLASFDPPRKHYTTYFASPNANHDMLNANEGLHSFLRTYFHVKSADWRHNDPHPLTDASQLSRWPHYYVMPIDATMPEAVTHMASPHPTTDSESAWFPDDELVIYATEFGRTGFQGGLNWYRCMKDQRFMAELSLFGGKKIRIPAMFLSGQQDWGPFQIPGAFDKMREACPQMKDENVVFVAGAGHWVQQERPEDVVVHLTRFLQSVA